MHHPGIQKRLIFQHQTIGQPFVAQTPMGLGKFADTLSFHGRWRNCAPLRCNDTVGELTVTRAIGPPPIGPQGQSELFQDRVQTFGRAPSLRLSDRFQNPCFLGGGVAMMGRLYQAPFFRRKFSLVISAITSRKRWTSLSKASSLGRSFLRPRG